MSRKQWSGRFSGQTSSVHFRQAGFSLIELMVASAIGLLIMVAILTLYLNVVRTNDEMAKTNTLVENGRFAIQLLQDDISHAGFWDGYVPDFDDLTVNTVPGNIPAEVPNPCLAYASWSGSTANADKNLLGIAVQVHDSVPSGCSSVVTNHKSGTDILVVRHANTLPTCLSGQTEGCEEEVSGKLYFQASRCEGEAGYVLSTSGLTLHQRNCSSIAPKRRYVSSLYYVRDYSVTVGDGIPTLVRSEFDLASGSVGAQSPFALIEGVEGLRLELGVDRVGDNGTDIISDTDANNRYTAGLDWIDSDTERDPVNRGDGVPDTFVHCVGTSNCDEAVLANVVAVKLHLLVRSQTVTPGYVDGKSYVLGGQTVTPASDESGYKRHVFSTVVRLNNVSARRETP